MKITDHIKNANGKTLFSFELIPPKKGKSIQELYNNIDPLMEFKPPFIDVTTSREEFVYIEKDGLLDKKVTRMRPGTIGICASIKHKYNVDTVPHVLCGGFTKEETEYMLVDCHYLGIHNLMALRGDAMREEQYFKPTPGGHEYALGLVEQVAEMNKGRYLNGMVETSDCSDFCIGVAGYPEKHLEAPSLKTDLKRLKQKVEAGADYVVTQMFFDNSHYYAFVDRCRKAGINVPIIPGLKILATTSQLQTLPKNFYVNLPDELVDEVNESPKNVKEIGQNWCFKQCEDLLNHGVNNLHYYVMNRAESVLSIVDRLG